MNLFVTGGTGFIGSHFLRIALRAGHRVVAIRRPRAQPRIPLTDEPIWIEKELADCEPHDFQNIDALVHFAAAGVSPQITTWAEAFKINVFDQINLLEVCKNAGVGRIVYCGSCVEYGLVANNFREIPPSAALEPVGIYASSKAAGAIGAMAFARQCSNISFSYLRVFTAYGDGQHESNFWPSLRTAALAGQDYPMTQGEQVRDFVAVEEVAARFLDVAVNSNLKPGNPEIHNIGSGKPQTLRAFAEHWWDKWEAKGRLLYGAIPYRENEVMRYVPQLTL